MGAMNDNYSGVNDVKNYSPPSLSKRKSLSDFLKLPIGSTEYAMSHLDGKMKTYIRIARTNTAVYYETEDGMESQVHNFRDDIFCDCNIHEQANFDKVSNFYKKDQLIH